MKGQVILILLLIITVALGIGLSIIQRSLSDISTATRVDQSTRAFSAAEAGVERALRGGGAGNITFGETSSKAEVLDSGLIPATAPLGGVQNILDFLQPLSKEDIAHVWLADFTANSMPLPAFYKPTPPRIDIYWGNSTTDRAAIEVTIIYYDGVSYKSAKQFFDHRASGRTASNNFTPSDCLGYGNYQCKETITLPGQGSDIQTLLRARLLYNTNSQPFAVQPPLDATCGRDCSLPPQARIVTSVGSSGETERKVQVFRLDKVVPFYFDYAIFSTTEITK